MDKNIYDFIISEETAFATTYVPLTNSKDWNFKEHVERCFNVSNGWFHKGQNDGERPYDDIVTPIIDVTFRSEGFDVKDIIPYVTDIEEAYKSFFFKKYHPQWARKNKLDTFIDDVVESSVIYDLVLIKDVNQVRPEVVSLQDIAFCDQTDIMSGPICIKHQFSVTDLLEYKGKWKSDKIDEVITMAQATKSVSMANGQKAKTPGKYIEVYELHDKRPESDLKEGGDPGKYVSGIWIVNYYTSQDGTKNGITLYSGVSKPLGDKFKALKLDRIRSKGRACGRSIVERLFEPQVWRNYSGIKLKKMLDASVNLLQTDSEEYGNKQISQLKENTIIKHEPGRPLSRVDMSIQNTVPLDNMRVNTETSARTLGSVSDASLGRAPVSGTPFKLQDLIVQQGEGIHEYRKGKIATFFADILYPEMIMPYMVRDMNNGLKFSEELTLDELRDISEKIAIHETNEEVKKLILSGKPVTKEQRDFMIEDYKKRWSKAGNRKFFDILKGDIEDIPTEVFINIAGKQKYMAQNADKLSNLVRNITANPQVFAQIPGLGKIYNELLQDSGFSPIDFTQIVSPTQEVKQPVQLPEQTQAPLASVAQ